MRVREVKPRDAGQVVHMLTEDETAAAFSGAGDIGQILTAWIAKEELRTLLCDARSGGQRHDVAHRPHRLNSWCANSHMPELQRLAATIETFWPGVLGFLQDRRHQHQH